MFGRATITLGIGPHSSFHCCVENGHDQVDLCRPWNESQRQYYRDVLLSQQMLPAIKHVAGNTFVFQQDNALSHRAKVTIKQLHQETPDFFGPNLWPPYGPDLNLVDYKVWGVMQQTLHECRVNSVDELKLRLIEVWHSLHSIIDAAINEWRKRLRACVRADGQHFVLNIYCEHV